MPVTSGFYNSVNGDRTYDAEQFGSLFDGIISEGVFPNVGDKFYVRATGSGMSVYVGSGKAWLNHRWVENSSDEQKSLTGANASLDRIDLICLVVDVNKSVRGARIEVVQGTPSSLPVAPHAPNGSGVKSLILAQIRVVKNSRSIAAENIHNLVGSGGTPYVSGPANTINLTGLESRLEGEFTTWFESVRDALSKAGGNTATDVANLKASDNAQNTKISTLETASSNLTTRMNSVEDKFDSSSSLYQMTSRTNAGVHNGIYRGAALGSSVTPYLTAIRQGTFQGLYLGDYWTYGGKNWRIVGFDYFLNVGKSQMTQHHLVVIPDAPLYTTSYHGSNSIPGGYGSFAINQSGLNVANNTVSSVFGSTNLIGGPTRVGTGFAGDGKFTSVDWWYSTGFLLTEDMVYGRPVVSPSGYVRDDLSLGMLPAFILNRSLITTRSDWWLRDIVSGSTAAYVKSDGSVGHAPFTYGFGVRPYYLVG